MAKQHRPVQVLIKPASADCNLACRYCFYLSKSSLYPDTGIHRMAPDVQEEMIRQILAYGGDQPAFAYQGGEPTLMGLDYFKRAVAMQEKLGKPGQTICNSIQTNGILLDSEWCAFLAQYHFLVGLSIDGPAHIHDHYRIDRGGAGTHERVMKAARMLSEYGVDYNILSVVTDYSAHHAREIYRFFRDNQWDFMQFIPAVEFDETGKLADFSVSAQNYGRFMCEIFDEWKKDFQNGRPATSVRLFDTILSMYCGMSPPSCTFRRNCGIYVVIEHNGDVYSCDFFVQPQWKLGNLMKQSLRAMLEGPLQREFAGLKSKVEPICKECRWFGMCFGGCTKDRMRSGKPGDRGMDYFCEANKMIFEHTQETFLELKQVVEAQKKR